MIVFEGESLRHDTIARMFGISRIPGARGAHIANA
jgi:hypothetical protein